MPDIPDELIKQLLAQAEDPTTILSPDGLFAQIKKKLAEAALEAEMTHHLGYEKHDPAGNGSGNSRNGTTRKRVLTEEGDLELSIPRDRNGTFEPVLVPKGTRKLSGFESQVIGLYARGMAVRDIQSFLEEQYGTAVSPDLISRVTDTVLDDILAWQSRPLAPVWPIVYIDGLVVKVRQNGSVGNRTVYVVLGVNMEGRKEVLGLWVADSEGAKFWLHVLTELKSRGVEDVLITVCDGLKGLPDAIEAAFPHAIVQTCIVHMVRHSLRLVAWGNRRKVSADLRPVYKAATLQEAEAALEAFEERWGASYPSIARSWRANWDRVTPFFAFPPDIRKAIYTTNAIEALNRQLRKVLKTRGAFPTTDAAMKVMWLALNEAAKKWNMPIRQWDLALQQFAIHFEGRIDLFHPGGA